MEELVRYMRAMVLLQLQTAQVLSAQSAASFKPEVLLADAGFNARDIAAMLGKSPAAVAKAVSRARIARRADYDVGEAQLTIRSDSAGDTHDA